MSPLCNDTVTMLCPVCATPFEAAGKRRYCSNACRVAAHRRRTRAAQAAAPLPAPVRPKPVTVYECEACGTRSIGIQRCDDCGSFTRRVGIGGTCPHCYEPVVLTEIHEQHTP